MGNYVQRLPSRSLDVLAGIRGSVDEFLSIDDNKRLAAPKYMIQMDDLLSSEIENFTQSTQLYYFDLLRTIRGNVGDEMVSSARIEMSNAVFFISNTFHTPKIIQSMLNGDNINEIKIIRLQNLKQKNEAAETIVFKNCFFQSLVPRFDMLIGDFRYNDYSHTVESNTQTGESQGKASATYQLSKGTSNVEGGGGGDTGAPAADDATAKDDEEEEAET